MISNSFFNRILYIIKFSFCIAFAAVVIGGLVILLWFTLISKKYYAYNYDKGKGGLVEVFDSLYKKNNKPYVTNYKIQEGTAVYLIKNINDSIAFVYTKNKIAIQTINSNEFYIHRYKLYRMSRDTFQNTFPNMY